MGLEKSGKTHFIRRLKGNSGSILSPTDGWNEEKIVHKGWVLHLYDIGSSRSGAWSRIMKNDKVGCLYYFMDAVDDVGSLFLDRNNLLAILKSDKMASVPVVVVQNINIFDGNITRFMGGGTGLRFASSASKEAEEAEEARGEVVEKRRSFEDLCKGLAVDKLVTWVKAGLLITDLSYRENESIENLLNWTVKKGVPAAAAEKK